MFVKGELNEDVNYLFFLFITIGANIIILSDKSSHVKSNII